mmetsp:Transcript_114065/g.333394  ORF Transcript_114065/g.333394 Transcript_114065/m.333394 type:complete len:195 (-) Transcript_114065:73-657(-)
MCREGFAPDAPLPSTPANTQSDVIDSTDPATEDPVPPAAQAAADQVGETMTTAQSVEQAGRAQAASSMRHAGNVSLASGCPECPAMLALRPSCHSKSASVATAQAPVLVMPSGLASTPAFPTPKPPGLVVASEQPPLQARWLAATCWDSRDSDCANMLRQTRGNRRRQEQKLRKRMGKLEGALAAAGLALSAAD